MYFEGTADHHFVNVAFAFVLDSRLFNQRCIPLCNREKTWHFKLQILRYLLPHSSVFACLTICNPKGFKVILFSFYTTNLYSRRLKGNGQEMETNNTRRTREKAQFMLDQIKFVLDGGCKTKDIVFSAKSVTFSGLEL